jgi:prepilin-type N-terminal cleavage/methylation domain-containing protein
MTSRVSAAFPTDFPQNPVPNPQDTANDYSGGIMKASISPISARRSSHSAFGFRHSALSPAFTLIELLVVIGIILILMGLFFAGAKIVTAQAKQRDTQTALETCKTMFENYKQATHLTRYPMGISFGPNVVPPVTPPTTWYTAQEYPPVGAFSSPPSMSSTLMQDTAIIMNAIEAIPENQKIITNLPPNKIVTVTVLIPTGSGPGTTSTQVNVPLILDGWGNPILFVPGGGLGVNVANGLVWLDGVNVGIMTSVGPITSSSTPYNLGAYPPAAGTPLNNQPFFVSAGPDGDFDNSSTQTDDNVYSFNN